MSTLSLEASHVPLRKDEQGVFRVGDSQVVLDIVIREFQNGASAEEIQVNYPSVRLPDVYAVIAYYLQHQAEVDVYLDERRSEAERLRRVIEAKHPGRSGLRDLLLRRRAQTMEPEHASPSQ